MTRWWQRALALLQRRGWTVGHNLSVDVRVGAEPDALRRAAEDLIAAPVDVLYADGNASASAALLAAATALGDDELGREALASFERVLLLCYRPGLGLAHYYDGAARIRGLLADHVAAIMTLLDAHDASGGEPYRMMAEELSHVLIRDLWDADEGGFFDRVPSGRIPMRV